MIDGASDAKDNGFLGQTWAVWSAQHSLNNRAVFDQLTSLNRCLQTLLTTSYRADKTLTKLESFLIAGLLNRFITNFQSAILLSQRGLNQEARILARSCLECCFMIGAATKMGPGFVERLKRSHNNARKKFGTNLREMAAKNETLSDDQLSEIDRLNSEYSQEIQTFDFFEMAAKGGLQDWYMFYRRLSNYAAHPSLDALIYRFDEITELVDFGPNDDKLDLIKAADALCMFCCLFCLLFSELAEVSSEVVNIVRVEFARVEDRQKATLPA